MTTARKDRRRRLGAVVTAGVVAAAAAGGLLLARGGGPDGVALGGGQKVSLPSSAPADAGAGVSDLGRAPAFSIETLSGKTFSLEPAEGPVVLSFIAGWCASCLEEAEAGGEIVRTYGDRGMRVLAIDADPGDSREQLEQFIAAAGDPPIEFAMDRTSEVTLAYEVRALDTTVIVDRNGRVVYRDEHPTDYETLRAVVAQLVS